MWSIHEKNQRPKISCYCTFKDESYPFSAMVLFQAKTYLLIFELREMKGEAMGQSEHSCMHVLEFTKPN